MKKHFYFILVTLFLSFSIFGQNTTRQQIQKYFNTHQDKVVVPGEWQIYDQHTEKKSQITFVYIRQTYKNIGIYNAVANFVIKGGKVKMMGENFISNIAEKVNTISPSITMIEAIKNAGTQLGFSDVGKIVPNGNTKKGIPLFTAKKISLSDIPIHLLFYPKDSNTVLLCWDFSMEVPSKKHWWSLRLDATTGKTLDQVDWVKHCGFQTPLTHPVSHNNHSHKNSIQLSPPPSGGSPSYNVYALPTESPNFGNRSIVTDPSDPVASPYKWHDDNGVAGAEYTDTRGNNVAASEDANANDDFGYAPDGGASLDFDFPLNFNQAPSNNLDPAITNLFYMNNMMHDIWYHYGFDEVSGNFQKNNYGNGGVAGDRVNADAQDGSGTNNSNFATPPDGSNPRMQMFLWDAAPANLLTVNSPSDIAGPYAGVEASFGPGISSPITADLVIYQDNTPDTYDACQNPVNGSAQNGKIVIIRRGDCTFVSKIQKAENAGAIAVIMVNNVSSAPISMGGNGTVTIPSIMISQADGDSLIQEIEGGATVNATLQNNPSYMIDGDYDNGIIAHEYGHGISTRLTGGASNSNCLNNDEQMGEGWSDWFALMLTIEPGDVGTDARGMATYAFGEPATGAGIRPSPYSTDMAINDYTYGATNNTSQISMPHGIGFIWATMLWDLSWSMIDKYGYDPDLYNGTGGNNKAMQLIITGLKMQVCDPGFVDGRDAILQADQMLYGGVDKCLIWNVFARRGLGYSADEGSSDSRTDQVEAFDLPPNMTSTSQTVSKTTCTAYTWPANGQTYTASGTYTAHLFNVHGCDSTIILNLTLSIGDTVSKSKTSCSSYTWPANGQTYTASGTYTTVLTTQSGCDSTVALNLTILDGDTISESKTSCGSYTWPANGQTYTASGTYTTVLTSQSGCDSTVALNLTILDGDTISESKTTCGSYTWPANGQTYTASGSYTTVLTSPSGCDSTVTLNLTISPLQASISGFNLSNTLEASPQNATSYQWLDCDKNNTPIPGATQSNYQVTHNGNFAVIVNTNNCVDTSTCFSIKGLGTTEDELSTIVVFPNPTSSSITIRFGKEMKNVTLRLHDISGRIIQQKVLPYGQEVHLNLKGADGIYILEIQTNDHIVKRMKITKME